MSTLNAGRLERLKCAETEFMAGRFTRAGELFTELAETESQDIRIRLRRGQLALFENRLDDAIEALRPCAECAVPAAQLLAETYYRARRFPEAAQWYARFGQYDIAAHLLAFGQREPCHVRSGPVDTVVEFLTREPLPLVRVQINGLEEALFVFDTGTWDTVVDAGLARRIGLPRGRQDQVGCADGRNAHIEYSRLDCLGIGAQEIADVPVQVMDLDHALAGFFEPHGIDGVLGLNVLSRFGVTLDMPAGQLRLTRNSLQTNNATTPCWLGSGRQLLVWGEINRRPNLWFLDTGMTGFDCLLPASTAMEAALDPDPAQTATGYGGAGQLTLATAGIATLQVDDVRKTPASGVITPEFPLERRYGFRIGGLLAFEFFKHTVLSIDFAAMRLAVRAASSPA
ncbi:MAG TPA: retropepsin-like aspartic protease [Gammaproteobacteria bacterium]